LTLLVAGTFVVVAIVALASLAYLAWANPPGFHWRPGAPPSLKGVFYIRSIFVSFVGSAANNFTADQPSCTPTTPPECGMGSPGAGSIFLPFAVNLSTPYSCTNLGRYQVNEVAAYSGGAFVVTNVSTNDSAPQPVPGFLPLPAPVPWGNATACHGFVQLFVTLMIVPQGPYNQTLFLTVSVNDALP
jgi:hypothetical protein